MLCLSMHIFIYVYNCFFIFIYMSIIIRFINVVRLLKSCRADIRCQILPITPIQYMGCRLIKHYI